MATKPDHESAMNFARKRHHRDAEIVNLARAYVEAVGELRRLDGMFDDMERRIKSIDTGPLDVSAYLDRPAKRRRKRRRAAT